MNRAIVRRVITHSVSFTDKNGVAHCETFTNENDAQLYARFAENVAPAESIVITKSSLEYRMSMETFLEHATEVPTNE